MHIGLLDLADPLWTGGQTFTRLLATVLTGVPENRVTLLATRDQDSSIPLVNLEHFRKSPPRLEGYLRRLFRRPLPGALEQAVRRECIEVILPALDLKCFLPCGVIGWIPDFQHKRSPEFFTQDEIKRRDAHAQRIAHFSDCVLFSSEDARSTFIQLFPEAADKACTIPFPSSLALASFPEDESADVRAFYHLPEKFLLVPNQFWRHKNHKVVIRALAILKARGLTIPCVFSGLPYDSRDPQNSYLSEVLQAVVQSGLRDSFSVLGFVPRAHLIALLRSATLIVQSSLSEGWSTSVQDARALGRPLLCSDLTVHREQAPDALGFFAATDAAQLADQLEKNWAQLGPGPNLETEQASLRNEMMALDRYSTALLTLAHRAHQDASARGCL